MMSAPGNSPASTFQRLPALESLEWLQGAAQPLLSSSQPKLCLLFQVNCPGCHLHAIPAANQLLSTGDGGDAPSVDVYAVSTAFEDFEYNTHEATKLLLTHGRRVGIVKERLGEETDETSSPMLPSKHMSVAFDRVVPKQDAPPVLIAQALKATKSNAREQLLSQMGVSRLPPDVELALGRLGAEALPAKLGEIFYAAAAQGTPTWILHDNDGRVLDRIFGSYSASDLKAWVRETLTKQVT